MALVVPVSGPYIGTFESPGNLPIGTLSDDGYELQVTVAGQEIDATDAYGMTLVEAIYRGQNWRCRLRGLEWKTGLLSILKHMGTTGSTSDGLLTPELVQVGNRWSNDADVLTLNAILNNPPSVPKTLTASQAAMAPNSQSSFQMTSKMRELPFEMVLFPYTTVVASQSLIVPFLVA